MIGSIALVPFVLLVLLAVLLARLWRHRRPLEVDPGHLAGVLAAHRKTVGWRWTGLGVGVVVAALTTNFGSLGRGLMLAPTVFGLCVIAGVFVGELAATPRRDGVRSAALKTRTVGNYLPKRLGGMVTASTVSLGALLIMTTLIGSADDMGRAGRSLFRMCGPDTSSGTGPWPGLFYSVPLGIAVAIGLLGAGVAMRTVVLRPRNGSSPEFVAADDALRQRSAEAVAAAAGVMVAGSLFGVSLTAWARLVGFACPPTSWIVFGVALLAVASLMLALVAWCLGLLLSAPRVRSTQSRSRAAAGQALQR